VSKGNCIIQRSDEFRTLVASSISEINMNTAIRNHLYRHVDTLAGLIGPRVLSNPVSIKATTGYIERQWRDMGFEVRHESFDALGQTATNLFVEIPGLKPNNQVVILGAHYDTVLGTPGADDNASAVATLLEVSRLLIGVHGQRTIRLIAFACEEPPYFNFNSMGSQHHAAGCRSRQEDIVGMLCLEMVGYFTDDRVQRVPSSIPKWLHWLFPRRGNFLAAVGNLKSIPLAWVFRRGFKSGANFPLFSICLPKRVSEIQLSDNRAFWDQGYPALMLTDTSFLRNPHYHQSTDLPNTLDYDAMTHVTLGVAEAVRRLARVSKKRKAPELSAESIPQNLAGEGAI
jgi:Peptidase family M28